MYIKQKHDLGSSSWSRYEKNQTKSIEIKNLDAKPVCKVLATGTIKYTGTRPCTNKYEFKKQNAAQYRLGRSVVSR